MSKEMVQLIDSVYKIKYDGNAYNLIESALDKIEAYIDSYHFVKYKYYLKEISEIKDLTEDLSDKESDEDRLLQTNIIRKIANLAKTILKENKRVFIVHGRDIAMRDSVTTVLGRLKIDNIVLETERNGGSTVIEKFIKNAEDCQYAIVLFSADDIGRLKVENAVERNRVRQNVILELGYFMGKIGRDNIVILHETDCDIEQPSDFHGIAYVPFDKYGGWKSRLIREMKGSGFFIDSNLADRI